MNPQATMIVRIPAPAYTNWPGSEPNSSSSSSAPPTYTESPLFDNYPTRYKQPPAEAEPRVVEEARVRPMSPSAAPARQSHVSVAETPAPRRRRYAVAVIPPRSTSLLLRKVITGVGLMAVILFITAMIYTASKSYHCDGLTVDEWCFHNSYRM